MPSTQVKLRENFFALSQHFPGFDEVLIQALFALVAEEHILWYSKPGRAKSMVARAIFGMFSDAKTLTTQKLRDVVKSRGNQPALESAKALLGAEINEINNQPTHNSFDLIKGWA